MIQQQIEQIKAKVENTDGMPPETKAELLNLLASLEVQIGGLAETHADDAHSVATFAAASTHEATRSEPKPELLQSALSGFTGSAAGLEASHPKLAEVVNAIAVTLSNMGI